MITSLKSLPVAEPCAVDTGPDTLSVELVDGRVITVPLQWFPRLMHATAVELANYQLSFDGIHWPDLNEDISVEALLRGEKSGESPKSIKRWLEYRARGEKEPIEIVALPPHVEAELKKMGIKTD
jgi:hypothetical protein